MGWNYDFDVLGFREGFVRSFWGRCLLLLGLIRIEEGRFRCLKEDNIVI